MSDERKEENEKFQKSYDKLLANVSTLAVSLFSCTRNKSVKQSADKSDLLKNFMCTVSLANVLCVQSVWLMLDSLYSIIKIICRMS